VTAQLKLIALDADDLAVISAHVQDARVQSADIICGRREAAGVGMSRLDWEQTLSGQTSPRRLDRGLAVRPGAVLQVAQHRLEAPEVPLELLGIEFHPAMPPAAARCSCSPMRRAALDVECLDAS